MPTLYEVEQLTANSIDGVQGAILLLSLQLNNKGMTVISHAVYQDFEMQRYVVSVIGKLEVHV